MATINRGTLKRNLKTSYLTIFFLLLLVILKPACSAPPEKSSATVVASIVAECPCTFLVATPRNVSTLTLSLSLRAPSESWRVQPLAETSHAPPRIPYAVARLHSPRLRQSQLDWHRVSVDRPGRVALVVENAAPYPGLPLERLIKIRASETPRNETCPVVIPQHAPKEDSAGVKAIEDEHRDGYRRDVLDRSSKDARPVLRARLKAGKPPIRHQSLARITGGLESTADLAKYMVLFASPLSVTNDSIVQCTGVLISPDLVITAAHCVYDNLTVTLSSRALVGGTRMSPFDGTELSISSIHPHPLYKTLLVDQVFYDIAWVRLSSPAPPTAAFMKVNVNQSLPVPASFVRIAGYGQFLDHNEDPNLNGLLLQVDLPVLDTELCDTLYDASSNNVTLNSSQQMCAGYIKHDGCGIW